MAEEDGCSWCAKWDDEIAHIYPKTAEGKTAPLKRFDLFSETPDVTFKNRVRFTPTFVLVQNGVEVGRIEGYPGEDFFWSLLTMMFKRANIPLDQTG
nr:thioredoxin family protein [Roseibium hamelinense]